MSSPVSSGSGSEELQDLKKKESRRPIDHPFIQQTLPTHYPVLNARFIFPIFLVLSLIFLAMGVGIYFYAEGIEEHYINYTNCPNVVEKSSGTCEEFLEEFDEKRKNKDLHWSHRGSVDEDDPVCKCRIEWTLERPIPGDVYIYYALSKFYQNHLRYYTSRDENQLKGNIGEIRKHNNTKKVSREPSSACDPYDYETGTKRIIIPCGIQANSMFFDSIKMNKKDEGEVPLNNTGIAWDSDKRKFRNPEKLQNDKDPIWWFFAKPPDWRVNISHLDPGNKANNGMDNEDFIIWMKTAAFPNFRKLHRVLIRDGPLYEEGLPAGNYSFEIDYNMRVAHFGGTKSLIITNSRLTAGKNYFLAAAFFSTGAILLFLAVIFFVIHIKTMNRYKDFKMD